MIKRSFTFEEQHQELQKKIEELRLLAGEMAVDLSGEIENLETKSANNDKQNTISSLPGKK